MAPSPSSPAAKPRNPFLVAADLLDPPCDPYINDPVGWVTDRRRGFLWSKQREIATALRDHRHVAVKSAHGTGKSYLAGNLAAWWLDSHPVGDAFVVTTAPTDKQVKAILWREIGRAHRQAHLEGRINLDGEWYMPVGGGQELVAYGRKPQDHVDPEEAASAFQGIHARFVLVILDEACGIPKWLYDATDSLATNEHARVLAIGNPTDPASHFAKVCAPGSGWTTIKVSAFDLPAFTGEDVPAELHDLLTGRTWVEERAKRWGESSPLYVARVLGEFPDVAEDTLIPPAWIEAALDRELAGLDVGRLGCDIARTGTDHTAIYRNRGGVVREEWYGHEPDTMATTGRIAQRLDAFKGALPALIDVIGLGAGVYDRLREQGLPAHPFNAAERPLPEPHRAEKFTNRRAQAYWHLREAFRDGDVDLDPADEDLAAQLGAVRWFVDSRGIIHIESKDDMRKRGMPSPDRADAVCMSFVAPAGVFGQQPDTGRPSLTGDLLDRPM